MEIIHTNSYQELRRVLNDLIVEERSKKKRRPGEYYSPLLFRGQADAEWKLETTLDRFFPNDVPSHEYRWMINQLRTTMATALGVSMPEDLNHTKDTAHLPPPDSPMMVYARHHGFPSPLLDWTESQYIALFFALASAPIQGDGRSALFVFRELCGNGKIHCGNGPRIVGVGPSIKTHRRHFQQKAQYTICLREDRNDHIIYAKHEEAFKANEENQDKLWKITLPWSEKAKVLQELDEMNVNDFTLFGDEESLMRTVANRLLWETLEHEQPSPHPRRSPE